MTLFYACVISLGDMHTRAWPHTWMQEVCQKRPALRRQLLVDGILGMLHIHPRIPINCMLIARHAFT